MSAISEAKHTPGPWIAGVDGPSTSSFGGAWWVDDADGASIAQVSTTSNAEINAHLIAAAPNMRDFVEATLLFHGSGPWDAEKRDRWSDLTGGREATTKGLCDFGRFVLSKAEGRTDG